MRKALKSFSHPESGLVFILAAVLFIHIVDFMIIMPLGPTFQREFTIDTSSFGLLVSSYSFAAGFSGLIGAFFIDRFDRKHVLVFMLFGLLVGTVLCILSDSFYTLLIGRIISGMFGGLLNAICYSIVGDAVPPQRRGEAMGFLMSAFSLASVFGVPFGLYLSTTFEWHAPFIFLLVFGSILLIAILFLVPSLTTHIKQGIIRDTPITVFNRIKDNPSQQFGILLMICLMFSGFMVIPYISTYMVTNVGFSESDLTYIYLFGGISNFIAAPLAGRLSDRYGKKLVFSISVGLFAIPVIIITNLPPTPLYLAIIVSSFLFIIGAGRMVPAMALITGAVKPENRGGFMSITSLVQNVSNALATMLAGYIIVENAKGELLNYDVVGYLTLIFVFFALIVVRYIKTIS